MGKAACAAGRLAFGDGFGFEFFAFLGLGHSGTVFGSENAAF